MTKNNLDIVVFPVLSPKKRECSFLSLEFNNLGTLKYQNTSPYFNHGETNPTMLGYGTESCASKHIGRNVCFKREFSAIARMESKAQRMLS
jgi:competence transcription factor ComK